MLTTDTKEAPQSSRIHYEFCYPTKVTCLFRIREVSCSSPRPLLALPKAIFLSIGPSMELPEKYAYFAQTMTATFQAFSNSKFATFSAAISYINTSVYEASPNNRRIIYDISTRHIVGLYWVTGHAGVRGKEIADKLARDCSVQTFVGPQSSLGIST
jgi:RNase H.